MCPQRLHNRGEGGRTTHKENVYEMSGVRVWRVGSETDDMLCAIMLLLGGAVVHSAEVLVHALTYFP